MIVKSYGKGQKEQKVCKTNDKYSTKYESREEVAGTQEKKRGNRSKYPRSKT